MGKLWQICFVFVRNDSASEMVVGWLRFLFGCFFGGDSFSWGERGSFLKSATTSVMFCVWEGVHSVCRMVCRTWYFLIPGRLCSHKLYYCPCWMPVKLETLYYNSRLDACPKWVVACASASIGFACWHMIWVSKSLQAIMAFVVRSKSDCKTASAGPNVRALALFGPRVGEATNWVEGGQLNYFCLSQTEQLMSQVKQRSRNSDGVWAPSYSMAYFLISIPHTLCVHKKLWFI